MTLTILVERITGGFFATVRDEDENTIGSAAMTTRDAAVAKARQRAIQELSDDDGPPQNLKVEIVDLWSP